MAEKGMDMLRRALDAFVRRDAELARAIPREDDEVDSLYNQVYRELITYIMDDTHDYRAGELPAVGGAQPRARCRPGDQHLRARGFHRHRPHGGARRGRQRTNHHRLISVDKLPHMCYSRLKPMA